MTHATPTTDSIALAAARPATYRMMQAIVDTDVTHYASDFYGGPDLLSANDCRILVTLEPGRVLWATRGCGTDILPLAMLGPCTFSREARTWFEVAMRSNTSYYVIDLHPTDDTLTTVRAITQATAQRIIDSERVELRKAGKPTTGPAFQLCETPTY